MLQTDIRTQFVNTINPDETGKLWDLRHSAVNDTPFRIFNNEQDVFLCSKLPYVYKLTEEPSSTNNSWFEYEERTKKDGFLCVNDYFCFSKTLLLKYGIGFILTSWLFKDADNKIKVRFNPQYLGCWYNNAPDVTEIVDDIYSYENLLKYQYNNSYVIPDLMDGMGNSVDAGENWIKEHLSTNYFNCEYGEIFNNVITGDNPTLQWNNFLLSRRFFGKKLQRIELDSDEKISSFEDTYLTTTPDNIKEFIYPVFLSAEHRTNERYFFMRCNLNNANSIFDDIEDSEHPLVKYGAYAFWEWSNTINKNVLRNYITPTSELNKYDEENPIAYSYIDTTDYEQTIDYNQETPVIQEPKYTMFMVETGDIYPYGLVDGTLNKFTSFMKIGGTALYASELDRTVAGPSKTPSEIIIDKRKEGTIFKTPSEYYSTNINSSNNLIDEVFDESNGDRNWFWLETLKNWCLYIYRDGVLQLCCWNGVNGWDPIFDIIVQLNYNNLEILATKYLYTYHFFIQGTSIPDDRFGLYVPVRYPNEAVGQLYYRTLVLPKDTISKNYNERFQNLHDTKVCQTYEYNDRSNYCRDLGPSTGWWHNFYRKTVSQKQIYVQENKGNVFGVANQYCPTVIKSSNGNLMICYSFICNSNGYGNSSVEDLFIISAGEANLRCRNIFGAGDGKTIDGDWKNYFSINADEEVTSEIINIENNETIYGAPNLTFNMATKEINTMKMFANRPNPTTNNRDLQDYLERWDR